MLTLKIINSGARKEFWALTVRHHFQGFKAGVFETTWLNVGGSPFKLQEFIVIGDWYRAVVEYAYHTVKDRYEFEKYHKRVESFEFEKILGKILDRRPQNHSEADKILKRFLHPVTWGNYTVELHQIPYKGIS